MSKIFLNADCAFNHLEQDKFIECLDTGGWKRAYNSQNASYYAHFYIAEAKVLMSIEITVNEEEYKIQTEEIWLLLSFTQSEATKAKVAEVLMKC